MKKYLKLVGIIILCLILSNIDLEKLTSIFTQLNHWYIMFAILLNIPLLFIKSYRWNRLLKTQSIHYSLKNTFLSYLSGIYAGIITPGKIGEFVKVIYLKTDLGIPFSKGFSSVLMDRVFDIYPMIILGFIGIWELRVFGELSTISLILAILIILMPLFLFNKKLVKKLTRPIYDIFVKNRFRGKIEKNFENFYTGIGQLIGYNLWGISILTFLSYMIFFSQTYLIVLSMGVSINFINISLIIVISNMIGLLPITIAGLGTRDAILIYLFGMIGFQPELAVSYSALFLLVFFICGGVFGALAWFLKPVDITSLGGQIEEKTAE